MTDYPEWNLEPEYTDLAWEDEAYDEEEYPYTWDGDSEEYEDWYPEYASDDDLPGLWTTSDFL